MSILSIAYEYYKRNMSVIPVDYQSKQPSGKWKEFQKRAATLPEIDVWFDNDEPHNIGIVTGYRGLVVIDFDDIGAYVTWLAWAGKNEMAAHVAAATYRVRTARGVHVYIRLPQATRTRSLQEHKIDIKAGGGYVLAPPSVHPDGTSYTSPDSLAPIVFVETLSTILPAAILVPNHSKGPASTKGPTKGPTKGAPPNYRDPWQAAAEAPAINEGVVQEIKARFRIEALLPGSLKTGEHYYLARCPFHDDHNPSFWVDTEQQICGCYAGCTGKPLDVINLYARMYDITNHEAILALAGQL